MLRKINWKFLAIFISEFEILFLLIIWASNWVTEQAKIVEIISSILFSFGALLLTTAIVYHHYWLHPEINFKGVIIEPLGITGNNVADQRYRNPVYERIGHARYSRLRDNINPDNENGFKIIKCSSPCFQLRIAGDVSNIGGNKTKIHEYRYSMTKPIKIMNLGTYVHRKALENEERATIDFLFPAVNGEFEFEIEVIATKKKSLRVEIEVSNNLKTIKWKEHN